MAYWDSANSNLTYWALSGDDTELATKQGGNSISHSARGVDSHDSGKKFFEVDFGIPTGNNIYTDLGFCLSTFGTTQYVGQGSGSWGFLNNRFYNEGALLAAGVTLPTGDTTYGVLIDLDNGKAWLVIDGTIRGHNGSAGVTCTASDVENGTNPAWTDTNFTGVDVFPAVTMYTDTQTATLLLTADEQSSFTLPDGYEPWVVVAPEGDRLDTTRSNTTYATISGDNNEIITCDITANNQTAFSDAVIDPTDGDGYYFEIGISGTLGSYMLLGVTGESHLGSNRLSATDYAWAMMKNGRLYHNNSYVSGGPGFVSGETVGVAVKGNKIWFSREGVWTGDPEAGTDPSFSDSTISDDGDISAAIGVRSASEVGTLRTYESEFVYDIPSGFGALEVESSPATTLTSFINESYGLLGDTLTNFINENYYILIPHSNFLNEIYGLKMSSQLVEYYGDSTVLAKVINEYYGDSPALKKFVNMLYGDSKVLVNAFIETYNITIDLNSYLEEVYTIAEKNVTKGLDEVYGLNLYDPVLKWLDEIYAVNADTVIEESSLIVTIDGVRVYPFHVNFEFNRNSYKAFGEIHLADQESYLLAIENQSVLRIQDGVDDLSFEVEVPRELDTIGETTFMIPAESKSRVLERAPAITREFSASMASELVTSLAAEYGISVSWEVPDWLLPAGTIFANGEIPLDVIRKVTTAIRARLQPTADGDLRVVRNVDTDTTRWSTAAPTYYLTDQRNFFRTSEDVSTRPGFNKYYISDHGSSSFNTFLETQDVSSTEKLIKGYKVPYTGKNLILSHSGGDWVTIESFGWSTENLTETIEIIQGVGKTTHPIYDQISVDYKETNLGGITFNEDGTIITETAGQSLIEYTYQTKFWLWLGTDAKIEEVQFWFEEEE